MGAPPPSVPWAKPLFGVVPELKADPLIAMDRVTRENGPIATLPMLFGLEAVMLTTPKGAQHVLVTNAKNYVKKGHGYSTLGLLLGRGLVTSEGDFWKRQRRIAQPAFHRERIASFAQSMIDAANTAVSRWKHGEPFDFAAEMMKVTLSIVSQTLLSTEVEDEADTVGKALTTALHEIDSRTLNPFSLPLWVPTIGNVQFKRARAALDKIVNGMIAERRAGGPLKLDLLAMLMEAKDPETGEGMNDEQLRDEVMTIFLAGHETTANNLAWTMRLLGESPRVMQKLRAEIDALEGPLSLESVKSLPYTMMVVKESLRLYPPVWSLIRLTAEDDVVEGFTIKRGTLIFISAWSIQRDPKVWDDATTFNPERWENFEPKPGTFIPFSMGQRKCIGDTFALLEAQLVLAAVLKRVNLELVPGQKFETQPLITLRPKHGVKVIAQGR